MMTERFDAAIAAIRQVLMLERESNSQSYQPCDAWRALLSPVPAPMMAAQMAPTKE